MKKVIFSGIQPSGDLHIGNYIGAIEQWVKLQNTSDDMEFIFCVVDLHAITVFQDPKKLKEKILDIAAIYLACGIDPKKSTIFVQSENPDHTYLSWIFNCVTPMGWLNRMTQFKDKSAKQAESTTVGLFDYPALMAADILIYDTDLVPVGEDQKQHVEITRDIAEKFNKTYGEVFKLPDVMLDREAARIMSLQNPQAKMSKSTKDPLGTINLLDDPDQIREKVKRAVTDSGTEIKFGEDKPAISNLLAIFSRLSGKSIPELEKQYEGASYAQFKNDLGETIVSSLKTIKDKYNNVRNDEAYLKQVLDEGRDSANNKTSAKLSKVKELMGLGRSK